jgi:hypothetical protein
VLNLLIAILTLRCDDLQPHARHLSHAEFWQAAIALGSEPLHDSAYPEMAKAEGAIVVGNLIEGAVAGKYPCTGYIRHPFKESLFDNDSSNIQMSFVRRDVPNSLYNHSSSQIPTDCVTVFAPLPREETVRPL